MSYHLSGFKWGSTTEGTSSGVITWSADFSSDLSHSAAYSDADFDATLQSAFDRWEEVASVDFQYVASGGDIEIAAADLDFIGSTVVGAAVTTFIDYETGYDTAISATIDFDTTTDDFWSPTGGGGTIDFYAVALHEIGHVLGLEHPDPDDTTEIMNQFVAADDLGDGDITGVQILYGVDAGDQAPPPPDGPVGEADGETDDGREGGDSGGGGGAIIGLLALLVGFLFGGAGAGVALAAGRVADSGKPDEDAGESDPFLDHGEDCDCGCCDNSFPMVEDHHHLDENGFHIHPVYWQPEEDEDLELLL